MLLIRFSNPQEQATMIMPYLQLQFININFCSSGIRHPSLIRHANKGNVVVEHLPTTARRRSLEHLAISPLKLLPADFDRLVPGPHRIDKRAILLALRIQLLELVALIIRRDVERWESLLPPHEEGTLDHAVVRDAVDAAGAEEELAGGLETGEEAPDEVGGHEGHGELVIVLVVDAPERVLVEFAVVPEPGEGDFARLFVGVFALPVIILAII